MKLILFDKETLTRTKSGATFCQTPEDQSPMFDFSKLPTSVQGYYYGIISNQKGISLGLKSKEFLKEELNYLIHTLRFPADILLICPDDGESVWTAEINGYPIDLIFDCMKDRFPHHFGISTVLKGQFRKPNPGMLLAAEPHYRWAHPWFKEEFEEIIFVGNMESDKQAAEAAGIGFHFIGEMLEMFPHLKLN